MNKEKSFGVIFFLFFLLLGLYPLYNSQSANIIFVSISFLFLFLAYTFPKFLIIPNKIWLKLGRILGLVTSPVVMFIIFFFVVLPTSIILKMMQKSLLLKFKNTDSYWIKRENKSTDMFNQF